MTIGPWKFCTVLGCGKKHASLSYCSTHYRRFKKHGDPLKVGPYHPHNKGSSPPCKIINCDRTSKAHKLCESHYKELRRIGAPEFWNKYT